MKFAKYLSLVAMATLFLCLSALAEEKHDGKFNLPETAQVGNTQLKAGDYKAEWNGTGPDVQVQILQHGKTVATLPGKLVENKSASAYNAVTLKPGDGNVKTISEIDFANRKEVILLNEGQPSGE